VIGWFVAGIIIGAAITIILLIIWGACIVAGRPEERQR
jgi:hypothetical protein